MACLNLMHHLLWKAFLPKDFRKTLFCIQMLVTVLYALHSLRLALLCFGRAKQWHLTDCILCHLVILNCIISSFLSYDCIYFSFRTSQLHCAWKKSSFFSEHNAPVVLLQGFRDEIKRRKCGEIHSNNYMLRSSSFQPSARGRRTKCFTPLVQ